jgi:hypothetical protein
MALIRSQRLAILKVELVAGLIVCPPIVWAVMSHRPWLLAIPALIVAAILPRVIRFAEPLARVLYPQADPEYASHALAVGWLLSMCLTPPIIWRAFA